MDYSHIPVMVEEVLRYLDPQRGEVIVDGTVGGGGHAESILKRICPGGRLLAVDWDPEALETAKERLSLYGEAVRYFCENFANIQEILHEEGIGMIDGMLLDVGVSSLQLEDENRGFSFRREGPLDMRMTLELEETAFDILNERSEMEISRIIKNYGEERWARRIAHFIIEARERQPIRTTYQLVKVIKDAVPTGARRGRKHPARKTFQALRIAVNRELDNLEEGITKGTSCLAEAGRMVVLTYHSLEDRVVKRTFRSLAGGSTPPPGLPFEPTDLSDYELLTKKPLLASEKERQGNPRSKSAKLRAIRRIAEQ